MSKLGQNQAGVVFITVLLITVLLSFIGLSLTDLAIAQLGRTTRNVSVSNALLVAEAGAERTLAQLDLDETFTGYGETTFFDDAQQDHGTYQTAVTAGTGPNEKVVSSTGRVYKYGTTSLISERKVRLTIVGTQSPSYSVFTGPGGLILTGNANLTNSDVNVNGTLTMDGNAQIGTSAQPRNVAVAHYACPPGANPGPTYPSLCSSGQPISITGGNARIYGTVCATNQTDSTGIFPGSTGQGLVPGCVAPQVGQPTYDRAAHIASMTTTGNPAASPYSCSGNNVRSWPANLRLNGNSSLGGNCQLTINGNVYITGNLSAGSNTVIRIADNDASGNPITTRPYIVVDGTIAISGNTTFIPNSSGIGAHLISYRSTASCNPTCTNVTGTDLKNSQALTTVSINGNGASPGVIFQAYWSKLVMAGNGVSGAMIGQMVEMSGNGNIVLGTVLSSGTSTWTVRSYQYDFD